MAKKGESITSFHNPYRTNYEARDFLVNFGVGSTLGALSVFSSMPALPLGLMSAVSFSIAVFRLNQSLDIHRSYKALKGRDLEFITLEELVAVVSQRENSIWLGYGFHWDTEHAQFAHEILKRNWSKTGEDVGMLDGFLSYWLDLKDKRIAKKARSKLEKIRLKIAKGKKVSGTKLEEYELLANYKVSHHKEQKKKDEVIVEDVKIPLPDIGKKWIHGLSIYDKSIYQPIKHVEGHTLIVGTTGAGKTRMFDVLITQAILRDEAVIIIDPKGDKEMLYNAKRACQYMGKKERFIQFHPAFPETSARIDPLKNFSRTTEVASRIAALIPSETGSDAFKSFGWQALNNIVQGLILAQTRPNIVNLKRFLENGSGGLVIRAIKGYADSLDGNFGVELEKSFISSKSGGGIEGRAKAAQDFYNTRIAPKHPNPDLESLLSMFTHDATHFSKMIASLLPIMNMLSSGDLAALLSPDTEDLSDSRPITDTAKIINNGQVAYIGLDSLTDGVVGSAIGSLFLSDLTAVAGDRYNFGKSNRPVNIFVDEASEVINDPFIQLLNKGRGAKLTLYVATQTFADFAAKMGSKEKALQVLGNVNNTIALRIQDDETKKFLVDKIPKTRIKTIMRSQSQSTDNANPIAYSGGIDERLMEEEGDLFAPQLLGMLPNLEFLATISGGTVYKGRVPILIDNKDG